MTGYVKTHHPLVAVEGAGLEIDAFCRQPISGEESGDRQFGSTAVTPGRLSRGEPRRQLFGFRTVGTGSMPPPTFLPGDWVDTLIDHRIPDVTLTGYMPSHRYLLVGRRNRSYEGPVGCVWTSGSSGWPPGHSNAKLEIAPGCLPSQDDCRTASFNMRYHAEAIRKARVSGADQLLAGRTVDQQPLAKRSGQRNLNDPLAVVAAKSDPEMVIEDLDGDQAVDLVDTEAEFVAARVDGCCDTPVRIYGGVGDFHDCGRVQVDQCGRESEQTDECHLEGGSPRRVGLTGRVCGDRRNFHSGIVSQYWWPFRLWSLRSKRIHQDLGSSLATSEDSLKTNDPTHPDAAWVFSTFEFSPPDSRRPARASWSRHGLTRSSTRADKWQDS